jgi:hypothetical protein
MTITSLRCILLLPFRVNENYRVYIHKRGIGIATFRLSPLCELASLQEQESVPSVIGWKHLHRAGIVPQLVDSRGTGRLVRRGISCMGVARLGVSGNRPPSTRWEEHQVQPWKHGQSVRYYQILENTPTVLAEALCAHTISESQRRSGRTEGLVVELRAELRWSSRRVGRGVGHGRTR